MIQTEWKSSSEYIQYPEAVTFMEDRVEDIIQDRATSCLWALEHPPLYTEGVSADKEDLLTPDRFPVYKTGRGGQFTYHGPGQIIVYTMMDLGKWEKDLRKFVFSLEEVVIDTLSQLGITGERRENRVGIWVTRPDGFEEKIAAIGVRVKKWVTFHGISLNINPDLSHFTGIVPCGISQHGVTSLHALGVEINREKVEALLQDSFAGIFDLRYI